MINSRPIGGTCDPADLETWLSKAVHDVTVMQLSKAVGDECCLGPRAFLQGVADIHDFGRTQNSAWQKAMKVFENMSLKSSTVFCCNPQDKSPEYPLD